MSNPPGRDEGILSDVRRRVRLPIASRLREPGARIGWPEIEQGLAAHVSPCPRPGRKIFALRLLPKSSSRKRMQLLNRPESSRQGHIRSMLHPHSMVEGRA
jgi:hypothetical protein